MTDAAVITCSNRSARGERDDDSGAIAEELLVAAGHRVTTRSVVPDDVDEIREAISTALDFDCRLIITTGGTGLTPTDVTPEAVRPMLDRTIPGIEETMRAVARDRVPTSVLSRGVAGTIRDCLVVSLPGSPGGVRDGLSIVLPLVDHILDQLAGGDHRPGGGA